MLKELKNYNTFASPQEVRYLLRNLRTKKRSFLISDLKKICSDYSIDFAFSFDGTLAALAYLSIVKVEGNKVTLTIRLNALTKIINSSGKLESILSEALFERLQKDGLITKFLNLECLGYDLKKQKISIKSNLIPLEFTNLLSLLSRINFFIPSDASPNIILINDRYQDFFETKIIPLLQRIIQSEVIRNEGNELSFEQFKRILQIKERLGAEAEQFALSYELKRLSNHKKKKQIKIISSIDVQSGYDIVSFNDENSDELDRFIEVKSYSSEPRFYWSKTEVNTARVKGSNYYLYLIDRDKKAKEGYCPIIIENPYDAVYLNNDWIKDSQEWLVEQKHVFIKN